MSALGSYNKFKNNFYRYTSTSSPLTTYSASFSVPRDRKYLDVTFNNNNNNNKINGKKVKSISDDFRSSMSNAKKKVKVRITPNMFIN